MLTLSADSACDVCAEEYGPFNLPRCIPCGHVLCATCAETIIDKTSPRLSPSCPFCRESFSRDGVRVIRIDFSGTSGGGSSSGYGGGSGGDGFGDTETCIDGGATFGGLDDETVLYDVRSQSQSRSRLTSPRGSRDPSRATSPVPPSSSSSHPHQQNGPGIFTTINEDHHPSLPGNFDMNAHRDRARELEKKVAKVATKRCSAEEVHALQRELGEWLSVDKVLGSNGLSSSDKQQHAAIHLSHLLLRAILMNHLAHSEATRVAKGAEQQLRARIADGELVREKLDEDLRKTKKDLKGRQQEVVLLRTEIARLRGEEAQHSNDFGYASGGGAGAGAVTPTRRQSLSAPTSPDGYFHPHSPFVLSFSSTSSASTAVPPPPSSRSNPASGTNSPCSSGRTTPTAGLALGMGGGGASGMMPMGSTFPPIGMTLSAAGAMGPGPGGGNPTSSNTSNSNNNSGAGFMTTSGGMSSASASAAASSASGRTFTISPSAPPARSQSTVPSLVRPGPGTSSASASSASAHNTSPARPQSTVPPRSSTPASPSPLGGGTSGRYGGGHGHVRSASMIHRSATVVPGLPSLSSSASASASAAASHSTSASASSNAHPATQTNSANTPGRDRRSMTPAPVSSPMHHRSASVAPGALSSASASASAARGLTRSMTPNPRTSNAKEGTTGAGNGSSAGGANVNAGFTALSSASGHGVGSSGIPPVPSLPPHTSHASHTSHTSSASGLSRPPVPPKPRTLSQSPSSQGRGVVDDRDGYLTERENNGVKKGSGGEKGGGGGEKKERRYMMHERWLPSALVDRMTRPATSQG